jgi:hypothetical protein
MIIEGQLIAGNDVQYIVLLEGKGPESSKHSPGRKTQLFNTSEVDHGILCEHDLILEESLYTSHMVGIEVSA